MEILSNSTSYTFIIGAGSATGYSTYPYIIANTGIPLATLNSAVGVLFLMFGWGTLLWCPIGLQYGRRGVYIISCIGCTVCLIFSVDEEYHDNEQFSGNEPLGSLYYHCWDLVRPSILVWILRCAY